MTQSLTVLRTRDDHEIPVPGAYVIDPAHTSVEFVGRHLMITKVRGRFPDVSGSITIADEPESSHAEIDIKVATLETGNVDRYPDITFRSTGVEEGPSGTWALTGDLTVREVTRPVTLQVEFEGASSSPMGDERIAFSAATEVDREDWGLTWNLALEAGGVLVGKKVRIELNLQAVAPPRP